MLTTSEINLLEKLGAQSQDALIVLDESGVVEFFNAQAIHFFGQRIKNRRLQNFVRHPDFLPALMNVVKHHESTEITYRVAGTIERSFTLHLSCFCKERNKTLVVVRDLTHAQMLERMRSDFVANVSHELRSPLTSLIGFIRTLRETENDSKTQQRFLSIMDDEALRMNRLISDLLSLSQQVADRHVMPEGEVEFIELARDVVTRLAHKSKERCITLRVEKSIGLENAEKIIVNGSSEDLRAMLVNLLDNAIKYGYPDKDVRVVFECDKHEMLLIKIINYGEGIDPVHLSRLTERFYRTDKARARESGGTGLGLAIVKHIVQRHRGRLRISSDADGETVFLVILPLLKKI